MKCLVASIVAAVLVASCNKDSNLSDALQLITPEASIAVAPDTVYQGDSVVVSWSSQRALTCWLNSTEVVPAGSLSFRPTTKTVYRITAVSRDGISVSASDSVEVNIRLADVSFSQTIQPLLTQYCALPGCHDNGQSLQVRLTSYNNIFFAQPQILVAGAPESSVLVLRIDGRMGQRMPVDGDPLTPNQINAIRAWIEQGARNN